MCRLVVLLAAILTLRSGLAAQNAAAWRDSTYRLTAEVKTIEDSLRKADEAIEEVARRQGLVASASARYRQIAAETLDRFDQARRRWFGEAMPSSAGFRIVLRHGERWSFRRNAAGPQSLAIAGLPDTGSAPRVTPFLPARRLSNSGTAAEEMISYYGNMMMESAPSSIQRWLPGGLPLILSDAARREQAMYALVTGDGSAQRACVVGDLGACAYVLGLRAPATPAPGGQYYPLARADLLLFALDQGGSGAWERLQDKSGKSAEAHLVAAAGIPADSLIARWRSGLMAMRPDHAPISSTTALAILAWSSAILLAALGTARWV